MILRTRFQVQERVAIAELVETALLLATSHENMPNEQVATIAALVLERAANIVRGDRQPASWTDADVVAFAKEWKAHERAKFNPAPRLRRRP